MLLKSRKNDENGVALDALTCCGFRAGFGVVNFLDSALVLTGRVGVPPLKKGAELGRCIPAVQLSVNERKPYRATCLRS